jgi:hypothetical protein
MNTIDLVFWSDIKLALCIIENIYLEEFLSDKTITLNGH